ncbi:MAG: hypothetical protein AB1847_17410 [bacterium]
MKGKYSDLMYSLSLAIMATALALWPFNPIMVRAQVITSIQPGKGNTGQSTRVTIKGADFKFPPQVALYGGGPYMIGSCYTPGWASCVAISGSYACIADCDAGLQIIDISDPSCPRHVGSYDTPGYARDVAICGTCAYIADDYAGLQVIDISDPASPHLIGSYDTQGYVWGVAICGTCAYLADGLGLKVVNISTPSSFLPMGSYDTPHIAHGVAICGICAYVADGYAGLQVIDISDPSSPRLIGSCNTPYSAESVAICGTCVYVADGYTGLQVMEKFRPLEDISCIDSGTIMATVPAGYRPGTYNLHVINPDGGYAILRNAFTVEQSTSVVLDCPPVRQCY